MNLQAEGFVFLVTMRATIFEKEAQDQSNGINVASWLASVVFCFHMYSPFWAGARGYIILVNSVSWKKRELRIRRGKRGCEIV